MLLEKIYSWNGDMNEDSTDATLYEMWYNELTTLVSSEIGRQYWDNPQFLLSTLNSTSTTTTEPNCIGLKYGCISFALSAFERVYANKTSSKKWGDVHKLYFKHSVVGGTKVGCLWNRHIRRGGNNYCINVGPYDHDTFSANFGPSYRELVDLSNNNESVFIFPIGQSANPHSKFYQNYLPLWSSGQYIGMKMTDFDTTYTLTLSN